jgi:hypothetical protein
MPPLKQTPEEIADEKTLASFGQKLPQSDLKVIRAAGLEGVIGRYGILNAAEQAEYEAIMARGEARFAAERRSPKEIFSAVDNRRLRALQARRQRSPDEEAELGSLLAAWELANAVGNRDRPPK